ncbi:hypothetical protein KO317_03165 [Candidatus Micrarchaeota archaeon]|jgi:hypothetical protein|nr:hypothetical protein [Candidatus Micrarchaeota archaeon]
MPKICFFLDSFFPNDPRVEKEIKTIQKIGWEVSIIALDKEGAPKKDHWDNCEVYRVKHPKFFGIHTPSEEKLYYPAGKTGELADLILRILNRMEKIYLTLILIFKEITFVIIALLI